MNMSSFRICRLARIYWLIFQLGRQLAILCRQLDFPGSISLLKIKISKIYSTILLFWISLELHAQLDPFYDFPFLNYKKKKILSRENQVVYMKLRVAYLVGKSVKKILASLHLPKDKMICTAPINSHTKKTSTLNL